ncbi:amino acid ABC transporter permease [uncultured Catenibacterium sp.]|uniref:amino acid ABC transporter permease n=1 Tax=uncultured Catenibacterium sp. TaxID=286142 RepID=UPI0025FA1FC6|nr:amino acid ABC transporter permease [uncultured Catenibacterium sp.]
MKIDFQYAWSQLINNWPLFWYGIKMTIAFAVVGTLAGLVLGLIIGAIRCVPLDPLDKPVTRFFKQLGRFITGFYVWVFRGTPMMVQAVFLYYLFKPVLHWNNFAAGMVIISINTAAYMAEIIRSGIQSIDAGQMEAAKSLGMTNTQTMINIIFPQAIKNTFPSLGNQFIVNIKDSCMLNAISVVELFFQAQSVAGTNMRYIEVYLVVAILYLILTTVATFALNYIEKKINKTNTVTIKDNCA